MKRLFLICVIALFAWSASAGQTDSKVLAQQNNHSRFALKTNLLFDALLVPNVGLEFNAYKNWTVYLDLMYAGLDLRSRHFYWDLCGTQLGVRKYFGRAAKERNLSGHHVGLYGQALAYDLQAGNIGQQTPGINMGFGLDYGYSFPIAPNLNLDVELGFGYLAGRYYEYVVWDGHYTWRGTINRAWWGPTKASVSLVWLIKAAKYTKKKKKK